MKNLDVTFEICDVIYKAVSMKSEALYNDLHRLRKLEENGIVSSSSYLCTAFTLHEDIDLLTSMLVRINNCTRHCTLSFCENEWTLLLGCLRDYRGHLCRSAEISSLSLEKKFEILGDLLEIEC